MASVNQFDIQQPRYLQLELTAAEVSSVVAVTGGNTFH